MQTWTAVVKRDAGWWIGWIGEIPGINCQERTREALIDSLRATLGEAIELNRHETQIAATDGYEAITITV